VQIIEWDDGVGGAQAEMFEEIPTMDFPFEGIPTVPPRKDMDHFAFFCDGCRYRVKGTIDQKASEIKKALWEGGCGRGGDMTTGKRKLIPAYVPVCPCSLCSRPTRVTRSRAIVGLRLVSLLRREAEAAMWCGGASALRISCSSTLVS